jgi:hypothetical protein
VDWDAVAALGLRFRGVQEDTHEGRRALKLRGRLIAFMGEQEDHVVLVLAAQRAAMLARRNPDIFFQAPSDAGSPCIRVRYCEDAKVHLPGLLADAWFRRRMETLGED